jgi:hypothetical protein
LGLALVVAAMAVGASLLSRDDGSALVWQAAVDLPAGASPGELAGAVVPVRVRLGTAADAYVAATAPLTGVLHAPVQAGVLIPKSALDAGDRSGIRLVTLPVDPLHAPVGLQPGSLVDVWSTPGADTTSPMPSRLVISRVLVADVAADTGAISGQLGVVLEMAESSVADVVAASRAGSIDLVQVPVAS